ncbi:MAG TPA: DUF6049 family protein, partial [Acidimicrobiales bacterium]|nr:DUF6049 family protein [Acidimicrobiales bacterium]
QPGSAVLTPASSSASATFDVSAIAAARSEIAAFDSFAPGLVPTSGWMARTVLASEASGLSSEQRSAILAGIDAGLADEASQISIPSGRIVTLTSSTGEVPVTIDSRSKTPLHVILALSNPALGLRFPKGTEFPITLLKGSTVTSIEVGSRTSGVFALRIELLTPSGHLLLGHGDITVRSTVLSGLAIGLSAGALLLLVVWWIRSGRRRRRERTAPRDPGGPEGQDGTGNTPEADTERSGVSLPDDDTPDVRVEHPLSEAPAGR